MKSHKSSTIHRSRRPTPYAASLAALPGLMMFSHSHLPSGAPTEEVQNSAISCKAVSPAGLTLDSDVLRFSRRLQDVLVLDEGPFYPDVTFDLHPLRQARHIGRVVRRDRPLSFVGRPEDYVDHTEIP